VLSEEVVRLRDKIANHNSESLATKNRLKAAVDRSNKLEEELQIARFSPNSDEIIYDSSVQGRNAASGGRRRNVGPPTKGSIRTAMLLNASRGDGAEQIGQVVDQIDSFAASTGECCRTRYDETPTKFLTFSNIIANAFHVLSLGKYLKRNPLARAGFIFYLVLIHLWTFVLLFFHAHSFDTIAERDFGVGGGSSHGPQAILQQQQILKSQEFIKNKDENPLP
jgi:hypothetical protein